MNKVQNCAECEFMKKYNYGNKIYYCNHEDRTDDIGKVGVEHLPKISPEWCPLRCASGINIDIDLIKIKSDIQLTDKMGNLIEVKVPEPEYMCEIFNTRIFENR